MMEHVRKNIERFIRNSNEGYHDNSLKTRKGNGGDWEYKGNVIRS